MRRREFITLVGGVGCCMAVFSVRSAAGETCTDRLLNDSVAWISRGKEPRRLSAGLGANAAMWKQNILIE